MAIQVYQCEVCLNTYPSLAEANKCEEAHYASFVRTMKGYITYHIWEKYSAYLCKCFWKENTFFTDGYFICSVGNVSEKTLKEYIENQG